MLQSMGSQTVKHDRTTKLNWTELIFISKVMSLLFNTLSRFVIAFHLRCKHFLISLLQLPSIVILGSKKIKICHCFLFFSSICQEVMGYNVIFITYPILNQSIVLCLIITVTLCPIYQLLSSQVRWSGILPFFVIHIVKGFTTVNEAEVDGFCGIPFFFYDPTDDLCFLCLF